MKLAFNGQAHYPDLSEGYDLYCKRTHMEEPLSREVYNRTIKAYCKRLAKRLEEEGYVELPNIGGIYAATLKRRMQYVGDKQVGFGAMDWKTGKLDGKFKTFGLVFLPRTDKTANLRCYGFVANRRLFKRVKERYINEHPFEVLDFNEEMI